MQADHPFCTVRRYWQSVVGPEQADRRVAINRASRSRLPCLCSNALPTGPYFYTSAPSGWLSASAASLSALAGND
jgi:hypothetical protein